MTRSQISEPGPGHTASFPPSATVLILGHTALFALTDRSLVSLLVVLTVLVLELASISRGVSRRTRGLPDSNRALVGLDPQVDLEGMCTEAESNLEATAEGAFRLSTQLEQGAHLLERFEEHLREEDEGFGILTDASRVARSASTNVQVVSQRLAEPTEELELLAQELEALGSSLEDMAERGRTRLDDGRRQLTALGSELEDYRSQAHDSLTAAEVLESTLRHLREGLEIVRSRGAARTAGGYER